MEKGEAKLPLFVLNKTNYSTTKGRISNTMISLVDPMTSFGYLFE
jgi:hypothetical protein